MTMPDGSPLRRLDVADPLLTYPAADDARDYDQAAELADTRSPFMDGHGYSVIKPYLAPEFCALCTKPIPLEYTTGECELDGGKGCRCNACIPRPARRGGGRFRYCSKQCKDTVNNARRRRRRLRAQAAVEPEPVAPARVSSGNDLPLDNKVWRVPAFSRPWGYGYLLISKPNVNTVLIIPPKTQDMAT
jgi:hypothetical protein